MTTPNYYFFWGGICSQWAESPFTEFGIEFNCTEQFMMAAKAKMFEDDETYNLIMATQSPREQKKLGRQVKNFDAEKWNQNAIKIVTLGNYNKFTQHEPSAEFLKANSDKFFVEASPYDKVWGIGLSENNPLIHDPDNWKGTNWLGICINNTVTLIDTAPKLAIQNLRDSVDWTK